MTTTIDVVTNNQVVIFGTVNVFNFDDFGSVLSIWIAVLGAKELVLNTVLVSV